MSVRAGIYLDSNAGAPLKRMAWEALLPWIREPGVLVSNPSSIHSYGRRAKKALTEARERVAFSFSPTTHPDQLIFTSSGTESNQLAIRSVFEPLLNQGKYPHWILSQVEHDSNRQMVTWLESRGGKVSTLPTTEEGVVEVEALPEFIQSNTALISTIWVNNETGVQSDLVRLSHFARTAGIPLHVDAAQAWGKLSFDLEKLGAQLITFSGHKIGALPGTGVLWTARGSQIEAVIRGKQEKGRRAGTENLLGLISMGAAAQGLDPDAWVKQVQPLRDRLQETIIRQIPGTRVNGALAPRVANTLNLNFDGIDGNELVMALDLAGYSVSSGSACSSGVLEPSHVLLAMGRTPQQAMAAVRVSLSDELSWEHLEGFIGALEKAVSRVRGTVGHRAHLK